MLRIRASVCALLLAAACGGSPTPGTPPGTPVSPTAPTPSPSPSPSTCMIISTAGAYTLSGDIGNPAVTVATCLTISTNNITVDCAGHTIYGYLKFVDGISNVVVQNCVMTGTVNPNGISNLTISNSTTSNIVLVSNGHSVTLDHNHISVSPCGRPGAVVGFFNGGGNQVIGNTIDGCYAGNDLTGQGNDAPGADDGIILENEIGDTIRDNSITNVFDAGIEGVDSVRSTTISNNTVTHAVTNGIASYWCTDWENNTIAGNTVSGSEAAVWIIYGTGTLCGDTPSPFGRFVGNTLSGNSLQNPLRPALTGGFLISLENLPAGSVSANVISANTIGSKGIVLRPSNGFLVGSGNVCAPLPDTPGAITC